MLKIGIYARKSMKSDQSDSIENQVLLGDEYIAKNFPSPDKQVTYYIDEDKSGGDMFRPDWERLISDMRNGQLDMIVCYKLDRVGRDVGDLALFYREIVKYNITVVPVRDNIEIKEDMTPVERGMMYINAVFSQMERENTIIRVTDNMVKLAEKGYWCGGRPPIGFQLQKVVTENMRTHSILMENPNTLPFFKRLVNDFLSGLSLASMETRYKNEKFRTPSGAALTSSQIWIILTNPNYAAADGLTYDYYAAMGCKMVRPRESFDGKHGILAYNRGRGSGKGSHKRKRVLNPPEKWIITVGHHVPILDGETFLAVQDRFGHNVINKTRKHKIGLLKGVLRCSCGRLMCTKYKYDKQYGVEYKHYYCPTRLRRGTDYCTTGMIRIDVIDAEVIDSLRKIALNYNLIDQYIPSKYATSSKRTRSSVEKDIKAVEKKITNLTVALETSSESGAAKYIISSIEKLDNQLSEFKNELYKISVSEKEESKREINKLEMYKQVCEIVGKINSADYDEINEVICNLFTECIWDGKELTIKL